MGYAEVCVNSPIAQRRTFSYSIPLGLDVHIGQAVWVPFGEKTLQGIIFELTNCPAVTETREIAGIIDPEPVLSPVQVALARWLSQEYLSPLFDSVGLMLPPGFERKALTFISLSLHEGFDPSSLSAEQKQVIGLIQKQGKVSLTSLEKVLGKKKAQSAVSSLVKKGLAVRSYELEPVKARVKTEPYLSLIVEPTQLKADTIKSQKQADLLDFLSGQSKLVPMAVARQKTGCTKSVVDSLVQRGLILIKQIEVKRDPLIGYQVAPSKQLKLTPDQESAFKVIQLALKPRSSRVFLLHGVTGSGKTEIYLQALAEAVKSGKKGIVLVPEISLTPQIIERFVARFPGKVAVLHSQLSIGEQFDEWHRIRNGDCDVVIGPRSALFAPQPDLGLIVIDEEHEWTYKQQDQSPHYHARAAALKLAELTGAVVVLGSATPDVESYYHAQRGDYRLLELPRRVTPGERLPEVETVDLREELKAGNTGMFSQVLLKDIKQVVDSGEQVILFLNRRGGETYIQCRHCGLVLRCRRCAIAMTHHLVENLLVCHQCNYRMPVPDVCPECHSRRMKFLGAGTEKLEQEASQLFPDARILRWDSDTTKGKHAHEEIMDKFRSHQADILVGTQMIAKGLDIPQVTLVGVVNADTGLNLPDFRAGERTFQLISQVAGRAGRGPKGGKVIIQTYSPEHYAIQAAAKQDYGIFYDKEINYRRQLHEPPFVRLASLTYSHTNETICQKEANRMKRYLTGEIESRGIANTGLLGPAPAFINRLRGRFRWQLIVRSPNPGSFLLQIDFPQGWTIDIDPIGL